VIALIVSLVRHAERAQLEFGLSARGKKQADALGKHFSEKGVNAIFSSPVQKAEETAKAIATAIGISRLADDRLGELETGQLAPGVAAVKKQAFDTGHNHVVIVTHDENI
jgi:broad specificity phosphatase PhoE